ncbi:MAG: cytochrome c oxidase subunit 3 [Gemmataceae bacterium]
MSHSTATVAGQHDEQHLVAHHFENLEQQREVNSLGMWLFLASEILFFGGVFTAYAMLRYRTPDAFTEGSARLNAVVGGINTAVLLTSSLTMALAVWSGQMGNRRLLQLFLGLTLVFGTAFLVFKGFEWYHEYEAGLVPGNILGSTFGKDHHGDPLLERDGKTVMPSEKVKTMQMFFIFYFSITGLHALHMIVGLAVLGIQLYFAMTYAGFGTADWGPIEISGLYWHFVDVVWIFVFPLLYLMRN